LLFFIVRWNTGIRKFKINVFFTMPIQLCESQIFVIYRYCVNPIRINFISMYNLIIATDTAALFQLSYWYRCNSRIQNYWYRNIFQGLVIAMVGYCMIGVCLVVLHTLTSLLGFRRSSRALGLCYVVVKVCFLQGCGIGWADFRLFLHFQKEYSRDMC
jgi:hypothetical protein